MHTVEDCQVDKANSCQERPDRFAQNQMTGFSGPGECQRYPKCGQAIGDREKSLKRGPARYNAPIMGTMRKA